MSARNDRFDLLAKEGVVFPAEFLMDDAVERAFAFWLSQGSPKNVALYQASSTPEAFAVRELKNPALEAGKVDKVNTTSESTTDRLKRLAAKLNKGTR
jgi:hypothetical protein